MARSIKRRAMFLSQASVFGLSNAEIIRAVDGRTLDLEMMRSQGILQWDNHLTPEKQLEYEYYSQ
ncbi:MAG: hypothetical protein WC769_09625 [Thermodesulfovibrionales bacterium]